MTTVSLASLQSCRSFDTDAWCKQTLKVHWHGAKAKANIFFNISRLFFFLLPALSLSVIGSLQLNHEVVHTLVLLVQFVGDHATYLGTSRTVCWRPCYIPLVLFVVCWRPCYIPWYFSYSLLATMLHTLVLLVQFVGDHADLEALGEATWLTPGPRQVVTLLPPTSDALRGISALCQSQKRVLTVELYRGICTVITVNKP